MESVEAFQTTQQEKNQQQPQQQEPQQAQAEKDQTAATATHDVTDRKQETDETVLAEEVSLVEEEVKISAVVDSADDIAAVSEAVKETSSLVVETTSESQPLEKVSLQELSSLIDADGVAGETNEEKAVPPSSPVNTNTTAVDVGKTKDAQLATDKLARQEAKQETDAHYKEEEKKMEEKEEKKDDLNDDLVQVDQDDSAATKDDAAIAAAVAAAENEAPDHADASPAIAEDMDVDTPVKSTADNKKKGKQGKRQKSVKTYESEGEDEMSDYDMMDEEYEVEKIAGHRVFKGKVVKYIVKWKGYPSSENTTENATTMHADVPELCAAYWATCKEKRPDNVPHVAPKELKPLLKEEDIVEKDTGNDDDAFDDNDDDDLYKPDLKARSPSPVAATSPTAASSKVASATLDDEEEEEEEPQARRPTPAPSSFTAATTTTTPSDSTTSKQPTPTPTTSNNNSNNNKRKRATSSSAPEPSQAKKFKKNMEHVPDYMVKLGYQFPTHWPNKSTEWDVDAKKVCVQASPIDRKVRFTYLEWNNGEKTIHTMKEAHEMIPEKLIHYYEERLQFV